MCENQRRQATARLIQTGQVQTLEGMSRLVEQFEVVLNRHGITIATGSELEGACCSVIDVLERHRENTIRNPHEDVRKVFTEVLGIWLFLTKVIRLEAHPCFNTFLPHLALLNQGTVVQNRRLRACDDAANKIFELLFGLVLLDVSNNVALAPPEDEDTRNPDILADIAGGKWGFACKVIYGQSGRTFFDRLKEGVDQIEVSSAEIGCVMINFRNLLDHETFWPILNSAEYANGAEPIFRAFVDPATEAGPRTVDAVTRKRDQVVAEIGHENVLNIFDGKKALPGFLAFNQTATAKATEIGPVPTSLMTLVLGNFYDLTDFQPFFENLNLALHERLAPTGDTRP